MRTEFHSWLDLIWRALEEKDPAKKDALLDEAQSFREKPRADLETRPA